ncbi:hypothetical protein Rsub_10610 [Raphidocelis subcapitata]|uniref:Uncharacterized protein n=1 Tax=Raphidocelis subcapitata TaxID=307507 RepID=A0A2V0PKU0_9CHLO|nr:hypothetical protein Rsub_10610 [Raphidocelis subcapitata]|eukprot:GBF97937.1 hypothetical protein Rsub_10610 [Raphidocelis subcapitata]
MLISALVTRTVRTARRQGLAEPAPAAGGAPADCGAGGSRPQPSPAAAAAAAGGAPLERALERRELDGHLARLASLALARVGGFRPQQFANVLWGLAALGHRPPPAWMEAFLAAAESRLITFPPGALARAAWALGALRYAPRGGWLGSFLAESGDKLGAFSGRDLANALWGLAALRVRPPPEWLRDAALALLDGCLGASSGSGGGGGGGGGCREEEGGPQERQSRRPRPAGARLKPHELSISLWALARLGLDPPAAWAEAAAGAAARQMPAMGAQEAANVLLALSRWSRRPPPRLLAALLDGALLALRAAPPDGHALAVVARSAARLRLRPGGWAAGALLSLTAAQWGRLSPRQLAVVASSLAAMRLPAQPPEEWLSGLEAASLAQLTRRTAEQRQARWQEAKMQLGGGSATGGSGANATDAAQLVWSMQRFSWRPSDAWWRALYAACGGSGSSGGGGALLRAATTAELGMLLFAMVALRAPPPHAACMDSFWARLSTLLGLAPEECNGGQQAAAAPAAAPAAAAAVAATDVSAPGSAAARLRRLRELRQLAFPAAAAAGGAAAGAAAAPAAAAPPVAAAPPAAPVGAARAARAVGSLLIDAEELDAVLSKRLLCHPPPPIQPGEAAAILWASAHLAAPPPRGVLLALATALAHGLPALSPGDVTRGLWAAARLRLGAAGARGAALAQLLVARGWARCRAAGRAAPRQLYAVVKLLNGGSLDARGGRLQLATAA